MIEIRTCVTCGRGPAGAGGICVACATKADLPNMLENTKNSFGLTAKIWGGNDNNNSGIIPKDSYSLNPVTRDAANKKIIGRPSLVNSIDGLLKPYITYSTKSNKGSVNYMINPNIGGYITNVSSKPNNRYVFSSTGYNIRPMSSAFDKNISSSYGVSAKTGYFGASTRTYGGASAPKYSSTSSASSSYSGKSSGGKSSGSSK